MRKIWSALAILALAGAVFAVTPARADEPRVDVPHLMPDDRVLGKADAPITIFEFFSLTCPHCAEFSRETFPKLKAEWIDTGRAKLVFRDFPLDRNALKAALVARCGPPERYPAFVETLFQQQTVWAPLSDPAPALQRIARLGGLSDDQFNHCLNDDTLSKSIVAGEYEAQKSYGVDSTPTFFINGKKLVGALSYDDFSAELGKTSASVPGPDRSAAASSTQAQQ